jgi:hypothetical protein
MSDNIVNFTARTSAPFISADVLRSLPTKHTASHTALRGLSAVLGNATAAVSTKTGGLVPGYAPRLLAAISACAILEFHGARALVERREISDADVDGVSDAVTALDTASAACLTAGDVGMADKCSFAAEHLQAVLQRRLWLRMGE